MRLLRNRIVISLLIIIVATFLWEFYVKPITGPLYTEAVTEYKNGNYQRSLRLLQQAHQIDPNDSAILALMGWNYLKLGNAAVAEEPNFRRAHDLSPNVVDISLGYAYAEIELGKYVEAKALLDQVRQDGVDSADYHVAQGSLYRETGQYREAAREFQLALGKDEKNVVAAKNLKELLNASGDVRNISVEIPPLQRAATLTYPARVEDEYFALRGSAGWKRTYLAGVDLSAALPGYFASEAVTDSAIYTDWLNRISDLGANTIRTYTILPPAFYRALYQFNTAGGRPPLWLLQGVSFTDPPRDDMFNVGFYQACQKDLRDAIDVIHGQGDVAAQRGRYSGGVFTYDVSPWVAGFMVGQPWLSHFVTGNNQLHPDMRSYDGKYLEVPSGSPTEIFLAQMINYAVEYEEGKYNWQHPVAFINWPTLDPMRHPTESTLLEEVSVRRAQGERLPTPTGPYDDDDGVSVDPTHLKARQPLAAGYFSAYTVLPYYPDFINHEPRYQAVRDSEGSNPFLGYLQDLKANHRGIPLVIADYGMSTSIGIGHFSPAGFDEGGKTEEQQGQLLARFTRNVRDAGAAGGMVFEWLDQWFRRSWIEGDYKSPPERRVLWTNFMNPAEHFGLMAADPGRSSTHLLGGAAGEWGNIPPLYSKPQPGLSQPLHDRYDPARELKALYVDADEGFLYLRLVVSKLDNDNDGVADWRNVNYLIGLGTSPNTAGNTYLPFISPVRFPMGMTYAIQLSGPGASRMLIASTYNPFLILPVPGIPTQTTLGPRLSWRPTLSTNGNFEAMVIEPNRRRFGRDGRYFPPQRYERGILRYGTLNPQAAGYDTLAEWNANLQTNCIDLRIPWNLLNVTDPSSFRVFAGLQPDGTVITAQTPGVVIAAFSYRPLDAARTRPVMEQGHPIADALPPMTGPATLPMASLKQYRWVGWDTPHYGLRPKASFAILRKAFQSLPGPPAASERPSAPVASRGGVGQPKPVGGETSPVR